MKGAKIKKSKTCQMSQIYNFKSLKHLLFAIASLCVVRSAFLSLFHFFRSESDLSFCAKCSGIFSFSLGSSNTAFNFPNGQPLFRRWEAIENVIVSTFHAVLERVLANLIASIPKEVSE